MTDVSGAYVAFQPGDQIAYVNTNGIRVWSVRDDRGRWSAVPYRTGMGTDNEARDLLWSRDHEGRTDVEFTPAPATAEAGESRG